MSSLPRGYPLRYMVILSRPQIWSYLHDELSTWHWSLLIYPCVLCLLVLTLKSLQPAGPFFSHFHTILWSWENLALLLLQYGLKSELIKVEKFRGEEKKQARKLGWKMVSLVSLSGRARSRLYYPESWIGTESETSMLWLISMKCTGWQGKQQ